MVEPGGGSGDAAAEGVGLGVEANRARARRQPAHSPALSRNRRFARLGVSERTIASFPTAFQRGMHAEGRARLLGDIGEDAPEHWQWGGGEANAADAVVLLYAETPEALAPLMVVEQRRLAEFGLVERAKIVFDETRRNGKEHFGFIDGISQPIVRGTPSALKHPYDYDHLAEPGEFILGYPDNRGQLPRTPIVAATDDAGRNAADSRRVHRPDFAISEANMPRDLGRNGSFLIVRQLEQHVDTFNAFLADAASARMLSARHAMQAHPLTCRLPKRSPRRSRRWEPRRS